MTERQKQATVDLFMSITASIIILIILVFSVYATMRSIDEVRHRHDCMEVTLQQYLDHQVTADCMSVVEQNFAPYVEQDTST